MIKTFPDARDLPSFTGFEAAQILAALEVGRLLHRYDVYTGFGSTRWYVWDNLRWERYTLMEWAAMFWIEWGVTEQDFAEYDKGQH